MSRIILQPTGDSTKNDFIQNKWISWAEQEKYEDIWEESIGDTILFVKNNYIFLIATIQNIEYDYEKNEQYPLRYFFNNIQYCEIPLCDFNEIIGYAQNFTPRKYMLAKEENLEKAFEFLNNFISKVYDENEDSLFQNDIQKHKIINKLEIDDKPTNKKKLLEKNGTNYHPRNINNAKYSLEKANFTCELNENHITFNTKSTGNNYVEAHHLIPLSCYDDFNYSLDVPANIISLCPNCHRMIHLGIEKDINKILESIYSKRKNRLAKVKLEITLDELQYIYSS